ncbi:ABC transporter permease [Allostreptomyces psammosilenae]|uniref:Oligopeptide transport system permease protein n=1 Tax=Allostreptomyces psammosilenae TaxID=1892865 RepID=A0A853ACI3_9ACTN|nr:ABC transporter permease [Allostreptomyces psammosilenae]NYI08072.1 oligopeptide transport system permease protein [Allostreptomyces psammosilenae]
MGRYVVRRILQMIPVFIGATFIVYWLVTAIGGDPVQNLYGERPVPDTVRAELTEQYHLNDPFLLQYWYYISDLVRGDFGESINGGRPIADMILEAWPHTLRLVAVAVIFEVLVGVSAGVLAGIRRGGFWDNLVLVSTLTVVSIPVFVIGSVAQVYLAREWGWFPTSSTTDGFRSYLLPGMVLGALSLAYVARLTRASIAENLRSDFIRTARAKGLPPSRVIGVHVLRNSLIPVVTFLGTDVGSFMGGAIVTEGIFNIPGVGFNIKRALEVEDGPTMVGFVSLIVVIYLVTSLLVDLMYALLDPRIRYE